MIRRVAYTLLFFMIARALYYLVGSSYSSFWQMYHQLCVYFTFTIISKLLLSAAEDKMEYFLIKTTFLFNLSMSVFYVAGMFSLNFFRLSLNSYVSYLFILLLIVSLTISYYDYRKRE